MSGVTPPIPRAIAIRAVDWHLALLSGELDESALQRWLCEHVDHRRAWEHIQTTNQRLGSMLSPAAQAALLTPAGEQRRQAVKALSLLLFAAGAGSLGYQQLPWREALADMRTAAGERRRLTLPGGVQLAINSASAVNLQHNNEALDICLLAGEILLDSMGATQPALRVQSEQGLVSSHHASRFGVRSCGDQTRVDVLAGSVQVQPDALSQPPIVLEAGQALNFDRERASAPGTANELDSAWVDNMLIAASTPLGSFLDTLSRHRKGFLGYDPQIAGLSVSGTYPLDDTDRILASLQRTLPVRLQTLSRYWVRVLPA